MSPPWDSPPPPPPYKPKTRHHRLGWFDGLKLSFVTMSHRSPSFDTTEATLASMMIAGVLPQLVYNFSNESKIRYSLKG